MATYKPKPISEEKLQEYIVLIVDLARKVDHQVTQSVLLDTLLELSNEVDNIEKGYRDHPPKKPTRKTKSP